MGSLTAICNHRQDRSWGVSWRWRWWRAIKCQLASDSMPQKSEHVVKKHTMLSHRYTVTLCLT